MSRAPHSVAGPRTSLACGSEPRPRLAGRGRHLPASPRNWPAGLSEGDRGAEPVRSHGIDQTGAGNRLIAQGRPSAAPIRQYTCNYNGAQRGVSQKDAFRLTALSRARLSKPSEFDDSAVLQVRFGLVYRFIRVDGARLPMAVPGRATFAPWPNKPASLNRDCRGGFRAASDRASAPSQMGVYWRRVHSSPVVQLGSAGALAAPGRTLEACPARTRPPPSC